MEYDVALDIIESAEIINPGTDHSFVRGCFGNKYQDAMGILSDKHKNDACPPELARTQVLDVEGFKCKVYYNYVPPYGYGRTPMNCWWGYAQMKINDNDCWWQYPLEAESLEDACSLIRPAFVKAIERMKKKYNPCYSGQ